VLRLAQQTGDPVIALVAHSLLGVLLMSLAELVDSYDHLQRAIAIYDARQHGFIAQLYGDDPGVTCHSFAAMCCWFMGYPDQALTYVQRALAIARESESPYSETFALDFATWVHVLRREEDAARACADALAPIATEHGFQFLLADSKVLGGWVLAAQGHEAEGIEKVKAGIAAYESTGAAMSRPSHLLLLAKSCVSAGRLDEALPALTHALTVVEQTGERTQEAELYRLRGELRLAASQRKSRARRIPVSAATEAEADFRHAIAVARRQQAKSPELRAATSLARLWLRQNRRAEAAEILGPLLAWFSEGFDCADLVDARALLAEIG
jgi:predicted ATPase